MHRFALLNLLLLSLTGTAFGAGAAADAVARGEYLFHAAGCASCHSGEAEDGAAPLAGGVALSSPFGTFHVPNITPHPRYGIGGWSEGDFVRAMRLGIGPHGRHYYPAFPYTSYARMRSEDMRAIKAYIDTFEPVARRSREHELAWYAGLRPLLAPWKWLFFDAREFEPHPGRTSEWNRGAYLVQAVAHCGECHTPRNRLGAPREDMRLAGTREGPEGKSVPNITPHEGTGIGGWSVGDVAWYLETGATPGGDYAGGMMADVIDESTSMLTDDDRRAIARYVLSLPAVEHGVGDGDEEDDALEEFSY